MLYNRFSGKASATSEAISLSGYQAEGLAPASLATRAASQHALWALTTTSNSKNNSFGSTSSLQAASKDSEALLKMMHSRDAASTWVEAVARALSAELVKIGPAADAAYCIGELADSGTVVMRQVTEQLVASVIMYWSQVVGILVSMQRQCLTAFQAALRAEQHVAGGQDGRPQPPVLKAEHPAACLLPVLSEEAPGAPLPSATGGVERATATPARTLPTAPVSLGRGLPMQLVGSAQQAVQASVPLRPRSTPHACCRLPCTPCSTLDGRQVCANANCSALGAEWVR